MSGGQGRRLASGLGLRRGDCGPSVPIGEGEQEFELAAGESVTVTGITGAIEVGAVGG